MKYCLITPKKTNGKHSLHKKEEVDCCLLIIKHNSRPDVLRSIQTHTFKRSSSSPYSKDHWLLHSILPSTPIHVSAQTLHSISLSHISLSIKQHLPLSHSHPAGTGFYDLSLSSRLNSMQLSAQGLFC